MKTILTTALLLISISAFSQWTYNSGGSDFDGKYRTSSVKGSGGKFPYESPEMVFNNFEGNQFFNFYLSDVGYLGCDNRSILFKFPDSPTIYKAGYTSLDKEKEIVFIQEFENIFVKDFFSKMKTNSKVSVRVSTECFTHDYSFSLSGSTKAIDFVLNGRKLKANSLGR